MTKSTKTRPACSTPAYGVQILYPNTFVSRQNFHLCVLLAFIIETQVPWNLLAQCHIKLPTAAEIATYDDEQLDWYLEEKSGRSGRPKNICPRSSFQISRYWATCFKTFSIPF
ncbi:hypothetical protein PABG_03517 [Paracoccidioides brasiliensis Pb03]|nr:hypothetical protein PABG_03517 [Paracoccidioides brasiliensis Pb03]